MPDDARMGVPEHLRTQHDCYVLQVKGDSMIEDGILDELLDEFEHHENRTRRLLESLREEILAGGGGVHLRIRQVFRTPREVFRLELELPDHNYQRTTFLDREALESLLEADDVRAVVETGRLGREWSAPLEPSDSHPSE